MCNIKSYKANSSITLSDSIVNYHTLRLTAIYADNYSVTIDFDTKHLKIIGANSYLFPTSGFNVASIKYIDDTHISLNLNHNEITISGIR